MPHQPVSPPGWSLRSLAANRAKTRLDRVLSARARARGWTTAVLGYPGYAAQGRARVRARLLLAPRPRRRGVAPIGTTPPETEERVGAVPVVRAADGRALADLLDRAGVLAAPALRG